MIRVEPGQRGEEPRVRQVALRTPGLPGREATRPGRQDGDEKEGLQNIEIALNGAAGDPERLGSLFEDELRP